MSAPLMDITVNLGKGPSRDEFILVKWDGVEGISAPYSYDVTLFRKKEKDDINPLEFVNTVATIGINKLESPNFARFFRFGVFEHLEKAGRGTKNADFRVYTGRIVPPFKMLDREILFRVFENQDVVTILETALKGVPHLQTNMKLLRSKGVTFPKMEYCVQFGESTFAFLSRLMARFGIHYYFDHEGDDDAPQNDTMVFGGEGRALSQDCQQDVVDIVADRDYKDKADQIAGFVQRFDPVFRSSMAGNFNILDPTKPFIATQDIDPDFDLARTTAGPAHDFMREEFPAPFAGPAEAKAYAKHRQKNEETGVATLIGRGANRTFIAGREFFIRKDSIHVAADGAPAATLAGKRFLLNVVMFSALDPGTARSFWTDVGDFFSDMFSSAVMPVITGGIAAGALQNYLTNEQQATWDRTFYSREKLEDFPRFAPFALAGGVASAVGIVGNIVPSIAKVIKLNEAQFSNTFVASLTVDKLPLKLPGYGPRPNAHGPHLATVIGNDGTDTSKGEISADALGRVRVRFPWDLGPRREGIADDPFSTGRNTCWVRVAQGWAGRHFGIQFIPRIGHEVVVEFIDGDPDCPIITGSAYNADRGVPNLPFAAFADGPQPFAADDLHAHTGLGSFERSGIKTSITPSSSDKEFHMLRFDDTRGKEQLLVRSQGRYDLTAFHDHFDTTNGNRHVLVRAGKDDKGKTSGGSSFTTSGGEYDLHVGGDRYEGVEKAAQLTVKGDTTFDLQAASTTIVGTTASLNATKIVLEAQAKITLKVGGSFVVIDPCGVFISGPMVQINSGGSADSAADAEVTDPADATQADPGDPANFLALQPKGGGGGGRRKRTVKAKHGFTCTMNPDGTIQVTKSIKVAATDPNYASAVVAQLSQMNTTNSGKAMLDDLDSTGKSVSIAPASPPPSSPNAAATATDPAAATNGTGSDSTVEYNPEQWPDPSSRTKVPGDVVLFHELAHAQNNAHGTQDNTPRTDNFPDNEEFNAVQKENAYRDDRGFDRRRDYNDS